MTFLTVQCVGIPPLLKALEWPPYGFVFRDLEVLMGWAVGRRSLSTDKARFTEVGKCC